VNSLPGQILKPGKIYTIRNEGMPVKGTGGCERGDLVVNLTIEFPPSIAPASAKTLRDVLGAMTKRSAADGKTMDENDYETTMNECHMSLENLAGREDAQDEEEEAPGIRVGGGGVPGCAHQ